jgi:hypothetical protein
MLEEKQGRTLAWLETGGIVRISRMWLPVSIVCFTLTAAIDGRSIYLISQRNCYIMLHGKPMDAGANWFILYSSFMLMLSFLLHRMNFFTEILEDALDSTKHDAHFKFMAVYVPILAFCVFTLVAPMLSMVIYWKITTSASCAS